MAKKKSMDQSSDRVKIIVAVIGALAVIIVAYLEFVWKPSQETSIPKRITYIGRVIDSNTEEHIRGAKVSLEFQDAPPIVYTDSEGIFRFSVDLVESSLAGRVKVEASGYEDYDRNITLLSNNPNIEDIRLAPTYTPAAAPIAPVFFQEDFELEGEIKLQPRDKQYWQVVTDDKTGNHYYCVDPPQNDYTHASTGWLTGQNYVLEVDILILESSRGSGNLSLRATRDSAYVYDFTEGDMVLKKEEYSPFEDTLLAGPEYGLTVSKWYAIRFEARNSDISVSVDGTQVLHAEDSDIERGRVLLGAGWGKGVCFDNVRVMGLESSR
jgi:hypothetical protein